RLAQGIAEVHLEVRIGWRQLDGQPIVGDRFGETALVPKGVGQVVVKGSLAWFQTDGLVVGREGSVDVLLRSQRVAEVTVEPGIAGLKLARPAQGSGCVCVLAL